LGDGQGLDLLKGLFISEGRKFNRADAFKGFGGGAIRGLPLLFVARLIHRYQYMQITGASEPWA
jgi:hypothetical protein